MYLLLLLLATLILVSLFLAGLYVALQKRDKEEETSPQIHNSGVYRLRRNPREGLLLSKPSETELREYLATQGLSVEESEALLQLWHAQLEANLRILEDADQKEIRTFQYDVPDNQDEAARFFPPTCYVTRDQLTAHSQLLPPFHLGCRVVLRPKNAWEGGDWTPLLPAREGKYAVPDWRTLVR